MAKKLCEAEIKTTLVTDAAIFALMARVDKAHPYPFDLSFVSLEGRCSWAGTRF